MPDGQTDHPKGQPGPRLHRTVVLVGMMGSGKTAVGRALATRLGVDFVDSDAEIERAAQATIPEIFTRDGEAFFRLRETEVINRLLSGRPGVLSTGGGAYLSQTNREMIAEKGVAVWLDAPLDVLWERVRHKDSRPLLRTDNPQQTLIDIHTVRAPIYATADLRVAISGHFSVEETTDRVIAVLQTRKDVLDTPE